MDKFHSFQSDITNLILPGQMDYPFYYEPNEMARLAALELQEYLKIQDDFNHNFGLNPDQDGLVIGKMFGVLVCRDSKNQLGYLAAVSGKLANSNHHHFFVPPVFDVLQTEGFFRKGEKELIGLTNELEELENSSILKGLTEKKEELIAAHDQKLNDVKRQIKENKKRRDDEREALKNSPDASEALEVLRKESVKEQYFLKSLKSQFQVIYGQVLQDINAETERAAEIKELRRSKSAKLQREIFEAYAFLNGHQDSKSLLAIFEDFAQILPPAGAGECAAPKMLQYAFRNQLTPIAMAEFWWGQPPQSEVRVHAQFYPACRGKCEPILSFMLQGIDVAPNPLLINPAKGKELEIMFEDDVILVVNKPAEFLSVPGKTIDDSVQFRLQEKYKSDKLMLVHRLDMSTSGILVAAKSEQSYKFIQRQFIKRKAEKRYVALLDGLLAENEGVVDLPLRVDLEDRPRQLVCYEHGKKAVTRFEVIERLENKTRVYFYPETGRTHQLRVHAAHSSGLGTPILGDDLYGTRNARLFLHAETLSFIHPRSKDWVTFQVDPEF